MYNCAHLLQVIPFVFTI